MNTPLIPHEELRQRFNPDGSLLRRQQMRMLHILVEVDKICQRHNIRYWLSSGTLIGAVRHGGFIPWDDDLDIEMMRSDYERLLEILPHELPEDLALQAHSTDPNYCYHYAKVRDRCSYIEEKPNYDRFFKHRGIYIDIFPLEKQHMWTHKLSELSFGHAYKLMRTYKGSHEECMKRVKRLYAWNVRFIYPLLRLVNRITGAKTITSGLGIPFHNPRYEEDIFPLTTIMFENRPFMAPHDSDRMLQNIYGDYMKLPDLSQLKPHTGSIEIYNNETNKH